MPGTLLVVVGTITNATTDNHVYIAWPGSGGISTIRCIKSVPCLSEKDTILLSVTVDPNGNLYLRQDTAYLICRGQQSSVQMEVPYDASFSYSWSPTTGLSDPNIHNPVATPVTTTEYIVTAIQGGCTGNASITVLVKNPPPIKAFSDSACRGNTMRLLASGGLTYLWTPSAFLNTDDISNPISSTEVTRTYQVYGYDEFGCYDSAYATAFINSALYGINITPDTFIVSGSSIQLYANHSDIVSYSWTPSTGLSCTDCPNPIASPTESTVYTIDVKTSDSCNFFDSVRVLVISPLNVPNAFTPNGDGVNDVISAINAGGLRSFNFKIYNRWGHVVFESTNIEENWDGTYKGNKQPSESYSYFISAEYENGDHITLNGFIALLR